MAIAELVMPRIKLAPQCYFCGRFVSEEQFCFGCFAYICETCNEIECVGDHYPEDHRIKWQEVDEDD